MCGGLWPRVKVARNRAATGVGLFAFVHTEGPVKLATERVNLRLTPEERATLDALAAARGRTRTEVVRVLLQNARRKASPSIFEQIAAARDKTRASELVETAR